MKYTKFIIKNYKGIPKIELDLSKKPGSNIFTLVGLNESGKTTLLEAIYLFHIHNDISKDKVHTLIPKSKQYSFNETISITAELELSDNDFQEIQHYLKDTHQFYLEESKKPILIKKEYLFKGSLPQSGDEWKNTLWSPYFKGKPRNKRKIQDLYKWNRKIWQEVVDIIKQKNLPKVLYYPDFLFKFPEKIYLEQFEGEGEEQEEYRNVIQDILYSIDNKLTVETDLLERVKNKQDESRTQALNHLFLIMSSKLNQEILKQWDTIFTGTKPKEVVISADTQDNKHFIELKIKQGSDSYSINDRSLGFRWFFSFLIFTAFRKSRIEDPGETLFLLDEPASNLHQSAQQRLLHSLEKVVSNCKLIYSTHSHHLINPNWLAGTYIVKNKAINYSSEGDFSSTETNISATLYKNFVAQHQREEDHFKPILDALDYTPSQLEMVPPIICTEGKNDYYILKYMMSTYFENTYKLNFYPGAGVNKCETPFRLYLAWNKNFIALFDSDKGGKDAKEDYIKKIGSEMKDKIYTFEDINSQWQNKEIEDFFEENEKIKIIKSSFEDHHSGYDKSKDKSKFNTAIQALYIQKKNIEFSEKTLNNFKAIFDFLHQKLNNTS